MALAKAKSASDVKDAISILTQDHRKVQKMFADFDKLMNSRDKEDEKAVLFAKICEELKIHTHIEEEIFYPAVRAAIGDDGLMDDADLEHACAKDLIAMLEEMEPGDEHYDAKVKELGESIDHHVKKEQDEILSKARKARLDFAALAVHMLERREELQASGGAFTAQWNASVA